MALAHAVSDKVEAAYRRGDLFEKRRKLASQWAAFCEISPKGKVIPLHARGESAGEGAASNRILRAATTD
jgi:hypothetical protein